MVYKFFDKKSVAGSTKNMLNKKLVHSSFKDNIWDADLAYMQLLSKFNKGIPFLLCVFYIFSKYAWIVPLKIKKVLQLLMGKFKQNMGR